MYRYDAFGWFSGETDSRDRATDLVPPTLSILEQVGAERANWTGLEWVVRAYDAPSIVVPAEVVPQVVGPGQMMVALEGLGLLDDAEAWVSAQARHIQLAWARASEFRRDSPLIAVGAGALAWDAELVDAIFIAAARVVI